MLQAPDALRSKKVLIADDEENMRKILKIRISSWGCDVFIAVNGEEAIRLANQHQPDIILLDIMMPGIDGLEACRQIKADEKLKGTPVVLLTARHSKTLLQEIEQAGADATLQKPYDPAHLMETIHRLTQPSSS